MTKTALVSSCLLGLATRYDGTDNFCQTVIDYLADQDITPIPICPEQLAGMPTPRLKCWFRSGDGHAVINGSGSICDESGHLVTKTFLHAAQQSHKIAKLTDCKLAILKQRSPSCGSRQIYQHGQLINGMGVTAALLLESGIKILSEEELDQK